MKALGYTSMATPHRLGVYASLLLCCVSGMQVPNSKSNLPRAPTVVSQAVNPLWVDEVPPSYGQAASDVWEVLCTPAIREAFTRSGDVPEETGAKMLQCMIKDGWTDLKSVWRAETSAPKLQALWKLCGQCPTDGARADLYAFVKASYEPEKTICIDNTRATFGSDKVFQRVLTRVGAAGLVEVCGEAEIDQVEGDDLCQDLDAIRDGQSYTFFPPVGQSEALKIKGTLATQERTLAGISKVNEEDACRSLVKRLKKLYGKKVYQLDPELVPYIVDPKETASIADGLVVVDAGETEDESWGNMVFVLEAKLSVDGDTRYEKVSHSLVEPKKGETRLPRFLDQFAGYEAAIREKAFLNGYTIIKVLATQTNMPKAMLKEQYMKDIEVLHREGDKFDFTGNYLIVTADSLTLPTPS